MRSTAISRKFWTKFGLVLCLAATAVGRLPAADGDDLLRVHFVDVGQGDAIWIQAPAGECSSADGLNIIIDGGPNTGKDNRLITYLETYGFVKNSIVDYAIVTHPHDDHYPGMMDILKNYQVRTIIDSGFPKGGEFDKFVAAAKNEKVGTSRSAFVELRKQPNFQFKDCTNLHMKILYGDSDVSGLGSRNSRENNASTVVRLEYKKFSFLFVGDLEAKGRKDKADTLGLGEKKLLGKASPADLRATVLKVGHHGSETSSSLALIRAVQPEVIVIQSGRRAFRGTFLPDASVLARYKTERSGVTIVRTDQDDEAQNLDTKDDADGDDIAIVTDGATLRVRQARVAGAKRRWVTVKTIKK